MRVRRTSRAHRQQENKILHTVAACILALIGGIAAIMLFLLLIWYRGQQAEPQTDEEVEAIMQREQAEPLDIEKPEPATEGSITIYAGGAVYGYFGDIEIINDGKDGGQIEIELKGWLVGSIEHGEPESEAGNGD